MDKRIAYVEIQTPSGDKQIKNIGMKFRVNRKMSENGSTANVSIANLAKEDVEYLTTYVSPYVDQSKRKRINIYAGYESTGVGMIFSGDIYTALPDGLPDTWLNIEAKTNYYNHQNITTCSFSNTSTKEIALNISNQMGLQLSWESKSQKLIDSFNHSGAKSKLINYLNRLDNFTAFIDNGLLKIIDKNSEPPEEQTKNVDNNKNNSLSNKKQAGYIKYINADSGLIGIPQPDEYGVRIKTLLDPTVNLGEWFKLESKRLPIINGLYQVYELTFDGATREPQFYLDIYGKNKKVG